MFADVYMWTPLVIIPSFYMFTGILKHHPYVQLKELPDANGLAAGAKDEHGHTIYTKSTTLSDIVTEQKEHLQRDWFEAAFGSV